MYRGLFLYSENKVNSKNPSENIFWAITLQMTLDLGEKDQWVEDSRSRTYKKQDAEDPFFSSFQI